MVIVIIGLLAAVVTPNFTSIKAEAQNAAETGTVSAVKSGIQLAHMALLAQGSDTYPLTLDSASNGDASEANPLFTNVIQDGVTDPNWTKTGNLKYKFKPTTSVYLYDKTTGTFKKQ